MSDRPNTAEEQAQINEFIRLHGITRISQQQTLEAINSEIKRILDEITDKPTKKPKKPAVWPYTPNYSKARRKLLSEKSRDRYRAVKVIDPIMTQNMGD